MTPPTALRENPVSDEADDLPGTTANEQAKSPPGATGDRRDKQAARTTGQLFGLAKSSDVGVYNLQGFL